MNIFVTLFTIFFFLISIIALIVHDLLVRHQYANYRNEWLKEGEPRGFIFKPEGSSYKFYVKNPFSSQKENFVWAKNDEHAQKLIRSLDMLHRLVKLCSITYLPILFLMLLVM